MNVIIKLLMYKIDAGIFKYNNAIILLLFIYMLYCTCDTWIILKTRRWVYLL